MKLFVDKDTEIYELKVLLQNFIKNKFVEIKISIKKIFNFLYQWVILFNHTIRFWKKKDKLFGKSFILPNWLYQLKDIIIN